MKDLIDVKINVMMFGGRRCGKTSVIAAMKNCFENVLGKTDLTISVSDPETMSSIEEKINEIKRYFNEGKVNERKERWINIDDGKTEDMVDYKLDISIKGKKGKVILNFTDYPGEWLINKQGCNKEWKVHQDMLEQVMKNCNIIMIAIDTVYLMEEVKANGGVGRYNEERNYCSRIANMIKNYFKVNDNDSPKVIMFVPLKCEKYFNKGQMPLVNQRIHLAYKEIFNYIGGANKNKYEVIIAPILTFGENTIEFARFERDANLEIIIDETTHIPIEGKYMFKDMEAEYNPKFCEQPLFYTLAYLLDKVQKNKEYEKQHARLFKKIKLYIKENYHSFAAAEDFLRQKNIIIKNLKTDGDGYEIINDPLHLVRG